MMAHKDAYSLTPPPFPQRSNEEPRNNFKRAKKRDDVLELLQSFFPDNGHLRARIKNSILLRLSQLEEKLRSSRFFQVCHATGMGCALFQSASRCACPASPMRARLAPLLISHPLHSFTLDISTTSLSAARSCLYMTRRATPASG